jgi:Ca-activated chloride channel family protein
VRNVYVDVFVTHDGKPVRDLTKDNFVILDNGIRQEVELVDVKKVPVSAMLVLDTSGSVQGRKLRHLREAAHAFVEGLEDKDEVGLVTMTHRVHLREPLTHDFAAIHTAIDRPVHSGSTALLDALFVGLKFLETAEGRPLLLLFTDGVDNTSWLKQKDVLKTVETSEAMIFVVGARSGGGIYEGSRVRQGNAGDVDRFLNDLAATSGGHVWHADDSAGLKGVFLEILSQMETRYLLTYEPRGVEEVGQHQIEINLRGCKATEIRARSAYFVPSNQGRNGH